ncbi:MAG: hypothetical protein Tsb006_5120 [Rickettsiaceae bacterium]
MDNQDKANSKKREQLYASIVEDIKKKYDYKLSETEAHEAARNLIAFIRELLK